MFFSKITNFANMNTDNYASRSLADILRRQGVVDIVVCPGSRNSPILTAMIQADGLNVTTIVDERSAGFVALGIASITGNPVAVVCTSGTALLNLSPAVAEAYYRKIPLIAVSADRPMEWIDQDDSQTLRQFRALDNFVKKSYDIPAYDSADIRWFINRTINDSLITACSSPKGPVHINLQIGEPLGGMTSVRDSDERGISTVTPCLEMSTTTARSLGCEISSHRNVMIIAGFMAPDSTLNKALKKLSALPNFVIMTETIANLHGDDFISEIDATLSAISKCQRKELSPDLVITLGGALVSRHVKQYLREIQPKEHWHVGQSLTTVDCFKCLTRRIEMGPGIFFRQLASAMQPHRATSDYRQSWITMRNAARSLHQSFVAHAPWCDLKAFSVIMPSVPRNYNLQLSNGTPIRYAQLFAERSYHRCDCNRGVSGIDGSTSTAVGASLAYKAAPTLLITGDMSAQYDIGALANRCIPERLKVIVICNSGGGIFHFIKATRNLDIVRECFDEPCNFPAEKTAEAFGFSYFEAKEEPTLRQVLPQFFSEEDRPAMLAVFTSAEKSAQVLIDYFSEKVI